MCMLKLREQNYNILVLSEMDHWKKVFFYYSIYKIDIPLMERYKHTTTKKSRDGHRSCSVMGKQYRSVNIFFCFQFMWVYVTLQEYYITCIDINIDVIMYTRIFQWYIINDRMAPLYRRTRTVSAISSFVGDQFHISPRLRLVWGAC